MPLFQVSTRSKNGVTRIALRLARSNADSSQTLAAWSSTSEIAAAIRPILTMVLRARCIYRDARLPAFFAFLAFFRLAADAARAGARACLAALRCVALLLFFAFAVTCAFAAEGLRAFAFTCFFATRFF